MRWLSGAIVRAMHAQLLAEHGGLPGRANDNLLEATLSRPRHLEVYGEPTVFDLAAAYGFGFAKNHCFPDGNKRLALMAMYTFLRMNGHELSAPEPEAVTLLNQVAAGALDEAALSRWLAHYCAPLSD